ncbi:MAG: hypothetical protein AAGJ35_04105, partial [Myxococcota bacterium]
MAKSTSLQQQLERFLRRTRRRCLTLYFVQMLAIFGCILCGTLLLLGGWQIWRGKSLGFTFPLWASLAGGAIVALVLMWRKASALHEKSLTGMLQVWAPQTQGLHTALQLSRSLRHSEPLRYSRALAEARVQQVSEALHPLSASTLVPMGNAPAWAYASFVFAFLCLGSLWVRPALIHSLFASERRNAVFADQALLEQGEMLLADLELTYVYPAYTKRPPKMMPNSDGTLRALPGTTVKLRAKALFPARKATLVLSTGKRLAMQVDKQRLSAELTLTQAGMVRVELVEPSGKIHIGPWYPVHLEKDRYPELVWLKPQKDLDVNERERVQIQFQAKDDFGLRELAVIYRNLSSKRLKQSMRKVLRVWKEHPKKAGEVLVWDLATMPFSPGDRIQYQLEVLDNDTIRGPKRTRSSKRYLTVESPTENHEKLIEFQAVLLKKMTSYLADLIERPDADKHALATLREQLQKLKRNGKNVLALFTHLQKALRQDAFARSYTLVAMATLQQRFSLRYEEQGVLLRRLQTTHMEPKTFRELYTRDQSRGVTPQEDDIHALLLLIQRQRLELIAHLRQQLSESQSRLQELLDKYKKDKKATTKSALLQEMRRIERLIEKIRERMSKLHQSINDEFVNFKAMKHKDAMDAIQRMRRNVQ